MSKRVLCFVEGDTEEELLRILLYKKFYGKFRVIKSYKEFTEECSDLGIPMLVINSENVDRIGFDIEENHFLVTSETTIVVIGDVERQFKCYTMRKEKILSEVSSVPHNIIRFNLFLPKIEAFYWSDESIILGSIRKILATYRRAENPPIDLTDYPRGQSGLEKVFGRYHLAYKKPLFANEYFSRYDFENCTHLELKRLIDCLELIS